MEESKTRTVEIPYTYTDSKGNIYTEDKENIKVKLAKTQEKTHGKT